MSKKYGMLQVLVEREYTQHITEFDNNFRIKLIRKASKLAHVHVTGDADGRVNFKHCTSLCSTNEVDRRTYLIDVK